MEIATLRFSALVPAWLNHLNLSTFPHPLGIALSADFQICYRIYFLTRFPLSSVNSVSLGFPGIPWEFIGINWVVLSQRNFSHMPLLPDSPSTSLFLIDPNLGDLLAVLRLILLLSKIWRSDCLLLRSPHNYLIEHRKPSMSDFTANHHGFSDPLVSFSRISKMPASGGKGGKGRAHTLQGKKKIHPRKLSI